MQREIKKILIANRGEIAIRIIHAARAMGIKAVALYTLADLGAAYTQLADECWLLEGDDLAQTYLNIDKILAVAKATGADALHPGYGFLSERPELAKRCAEAGIKFIGPSPQVIHQMGNKLEARRLVQEMGAPLLQSVQGSQEELLSKGAQMIYPVLCKAASGGGGKGMRIVEKPEDLPAALATTSREALASFGDETVYLETYLKNPRHIEIQILADEHGQVLHLGERECSIQRRHQKIVEESPSPLLDAATRAKMGQEAVKIAQYIGYTNAGTIEFLADENKNFYFLEMNTRIQVEHPVTELAYGVDLVKEQIRIARGEALNLKQEDLTPRGHAIECRIYAEDPEANFRPAPGVITCYKEAEGPWVRNDSAIAGPVEISPKFDPMISKLVVWGRTRADAIERMKAALADSIIQGISHNIPYLAKVMDHPAFVAGNFSTSFCELYHQELVEQLETQRSEADPQVPLLAAAILKAFGKRQSSPAAGAENSEPSPWLGLGAWRN